MGALVLPMRPGIRLRSVTQEWSEGEVDATRRTRLAAERTYLAWWRSALAAFAVSLGVGKVVPELTSGKSVGYELVGSGYALLGIAFIGYGYYRQQLMERALVEGRFVPFDRRVALAFSVAGIVLGFATLLAIVA
jgi:putative membrane protein